MTLYEVKSSKRFKKDLKKVEKRNYDLSLIKTVIKLLADGKPLPEVYGDHPLVGNWVGHRECHIAPDWLLIYRIDDGVLVLTLTRTGSHSDLLE